MPNDLPFVFGNIDEYQLLKFKSIIDNSNYDYNKIKNLYFFQSQRWDFENHYGVLIKLPKNNVKETLELIDKAYIIHEGKVLMHGSPNEIIEDENVRRVYLGKKFNL